MDHLREFLFLRTQTTIMYISINALPESQRDLICTLSHKARSVADRNFRFNEMRMKISETAACSWEVAQVLQHLYRLILC